MKRSTRITISIQKEMFLFNFLALVLVTVVLSGFFFQVLLTDKQENADHAMQEYSERIAVYISQVAQKNSVLLETLARDEDVIRGNKQEALALYDTITQYNQDCTYVYSAYEDGTMLVNGYQLPEGVSPTTRDWYQAAMKSDDVVSIVYQDAVTEEWMFSQCKRLVDENGQTVGVVAIDCANDRLVSALSGGHIYPSQRSFLVDEEGSVLIYYKSSGVTKSMIDFLGEETWQQVQLGNVQKVEYNLDGRPVFGYFKSIYGTSMYAVTALDKSDIVQPLQSWLVTRLLIVLGICLLVGVVISEVMSFRYARPVMVLGNRIRAIADGKPEEPAPIPFSNGEIGRIAENIQCIVTNIAQREKRWQTAEHLSFHDSMTGLYNRRFFDEKQRQWDRKENYPLCFISCDINGLKLVNDLLGHSVGDRVICRVAECLKAGCRAQDILARVGGDEFIIVLPHTMEASAEKVRARMDRIFAHEEVCGAVVSVSLGYAVKMERMGSLVETLNRADQMMYVQKRERSILMRRKTLENIREKAREEGLLPPLTSREEQFLTRMAQKFCPQEEELLRQGYAQRRIGLCSLLQMGAPDTDPHRHSEVGYRFLIQEDKQSPLAGYVLHSTEHWDGSGWPTGLMGKSIPVPSRLIRILEAYFSPEGGLEVIHQHRDWFDPEMLEELERLDLELGETKTPQ